MAALINTVPPNSLEAEQATLGCMILDGKAIDEARTIVCEEDFYREAHRIIFRCLCELRDSKTEADLTTLAARLEDHGTLERAGGRPYLAGLMDTIVSSSFVPYYADIVKKLGTRRNIIKTAHHLLESAMAGETDPSEITQTGISALEGLCKRHIKGKPTPLAETLESVRETLLYMRQHKRGVTGVASGYGALDAYTNGFQKADLIIIAARPSMGKTAFAMNTAVTVASGGTPVYVMSYEMSKEALALRMVQAEARVASQSLRSGFTTEDENLAIDEAMERLGGIPLHIDDGADRDIQTLRAKILRMADEGAGLVIVDYLQLLHYPGYRDGRVNEIGEIAQILKETAKDTGIPIMVLSQLSRKVEQRDDKRPMLSDLLESGKIEAAADLVLMLYRPAYYAMKEADAKPDPSAAEEAELIVAKHRNGPTGMVPLIFLPGYARFESKSLIEPDLTEEELANRKLEDFFE